MLDESLATQSDELAQELLACRVCADSNISRSRKGEQVLQDISQLKGVRQNDLHRNVLRIVYFWFGFHVINENGRTEFPNCVRPTNGLMQTKCILIEQQKPVLILRVPLDNQHQNLGQQKAVSRCVAVSSHGVLLLPSLPTSFCWLRYTCERLVTVAP